MASFKTIRHLLDEGAEFAGSVEELIASAKDGVITKDGSRLTDDRIDLSGLGLTRLPPLPRVVNKALLINNNVLTSLKGCPERVDDLFDCSSNQLETLRHGPRSFVRIYQCGGNELVSLDGAPARCFGFYAERNPRLTRLSGVPKASKILYLAGCGLESLEGIHRRIESASTINLVKNNLRHAILGLLLIKDVKFVVLPKALENANGLNLNRLFREFLSKPPAERQRSELIRVQSLMLDHGLDELAKI